jgi:hypothetical protein
MKKIGPEAVLKAEGGLKTGEVGRPWERGLRIWTSTVTRKRQKNVLRMVEY